MGRVKGSESFRCDSRGVPRDGRNGKRRRDEEPGESRGRDVEERSESRIVVLPFYHPTEARTGEDDVALVTV